MGSGCSAPTHSVAAEELSAESLNSLLVSFVRVAPEELSALSPKKQMQSKEVEDFFSEEEFRAVRSDQRNQIFERPEGDVASSPTMDSGGQVPDLPGYLEELSEDLSAMGEEREIGKSPIEKLAARNQLADVDEIEFEKHLCSTFKSTVRLGMWQHQRVVVKLINDGLMTTCEPEAEEIREITKHEMLHEIDVLSALQHPCIVRFLGGNYNPVCFMLFEYMEQGDVETYMENQRAKKTFTHTYKPPNNLGLQWCISTAEALSFLHAQECQIIHRDLKPLNLLLSRNLELKLADFGTSKVLRNPKDAEPAPKMSGGVGTWRYMAPEVVRYEQYTDRIDVYSFSLVMYFILTGKQPFQEFCKNDPELILKAYLRGEEPRPALAQSISKQLQQLMQDAWAAQASARPSAQECLERLQITQMTKSAENDKVLPTLRGMFWSE